MKTLRNTKKFFLPRMLEMKHNGWFFGPMGSAVLLAIACLSVAPAAHAGADASKILGKAIGHYIGTAGEINEEKANELFRKAEATNDPLAIMWIARLHAGGRCGFAQDTEYAKKLAAGVLDEIKKRAEAGDEEATFLLASANYESIGMEKNLEEAARLYQKSGEAGNLLSMVSLGDMYCSGEGLPKDPAAGVTWYKKAVDAKYPLAMTRLGRAYRFGTGLPKDFNEAARLFEAAAKKGEKWAMAELGLCYHSGEGVSKDLKKYFKWSKDAAEKGIPYAMGNTALAYKNGQGIEQNQVEATRWYIKAAEAGFVPAMCVAGTRYYTGNGIEKDPAKAFFWTKKGAEGGDREAMNNLGFYYGNGDGVAKDETEAMKWYKKSAEAGDPVGMKNVANNYKRALGVPKDEKQALEWYKKALEAGKGESKEWHAEIKTYIQELEASVAKKEEAQQQAAEEERRATEAKQQRLKQEETTRQQAEEQRQKETAAREEADRKAAEEKDAARKQAEQEWSDMLPKINAAESSGDLKTAVSLLKEADQKGYGGSEVTQRLSAIYSSPAWQGARQRISIQKFEVAEGVSPGLSKFLYNSLISEAVKSPAYSVVDWEEIDRVLKYLATSQPNLSPDEAKKQAINQLGIKQMFLGSLEKVGAQYFVTIKVLNLDLTVTKVVQDSVPNEEGLADLIAKMAAKLF
ncbi:MAG TPA: hypothetical protein PLI09_00625 [Candidatus Hydrogenedentes bacterium]|nr:hypothetical protein [Candidatus Hydrogenedentota bacterium]